MVVSTLALVIVGGPIDAPAADPSVEAIRAWFSDAEV